MSEIPRVFLRSRLCPSRALALATLLLTGSVAPLQAATATLETNTTGGAGHVRSPFDKASQRKIVRTPAGSARDPFTYVVYTRYNGATLTTEIVLARSRSIFLSDVEKIVLFGQGGAAWANVTDSFAFPAIEVSADGQQLHVVALNRTQADVVYTKNVAIAGAAWQTAWTQAGGGTAPRYDVVSTTAYTTTAPVVALDSSSRAHVAWVRAASGAPFAPNVFYSRYTGAAWSAEMALTAIAGVGSFPDELDPSIDFANGLVHVLYKDDQNTGDGTPKTDRFRYVRNTVASNFAAFTAPVTVMQPVVAQNDFGLPGSIAVKGNGVWVTGGFLGGFNNVGYYNYSTDAGTSWVIDGPGTENDLYECDGTQKAPAPIGLNSQGNDHRLYAMRRDSRTIYAFEWGGSTWIDGGAGTCASHNNYIAVSAAATVADDSRHLSVEKRKLPQQTALVYCWYNSNTNVAPPRTADTLYCDSDTGPPSFVGPRTYHRSIGTRPDYGTNTTVCPTCTEGLTTTVTTAAGTRTVTGSGTQWLAFNRGPGDVLRVSGVNYMVTQVLSDTELVTEQPIFGSGAGLDYSLRRQETRLQDWANCVADTPVDVCRFFDAPTTSLVADDRIEIGYAYDDSPFLHSTGGTLAGQPVLRIAGMTTSATRDVRLTATHANRHYGTAGAGVVVDNEANNGSAVEIPANNFVTVEWLEVKGGGSGTDGIRVATGPIAANKIVLHANIVHNTGGDGIEVEDSNASVKVYNNFVYRNGANGIYLSAFLWNGGSVIDVLNDTFYENGSLGCCYAGVKSAIAMPATLTLRNTLSINHFVTSGTDFAIPDDASDGWADLAAASSNNMSTDTSANSPRHCGAFSCTDGATASFVFQDTVLPNLHLSSGSLARGQGANLGTQGHGFFTDIDAGFRSTGVNWDIGADEYAATTAVRLMAFGAAPGDASVRLEWQTASELDNLGFHVWRSAAAGGPWTRATATLVPGLGSSATGKSYSWVDSGLANGVRYYYRLEDVDTASVSTFHGPVSAVPQAPPAPAATRGTRTLPARRGAAGADGACPAWLLAAAGDVVAGDVRCDRHGQPETTSFAVVTRDARGAELELRTGGFWTLRAAARPGAPEAAVRVFVPGFDTPSDPASPALPLKRALVEAIVGRKVSLESAEALELQRFRGLRPAATGAAEMAVGMDGSVRAARRQAAALRSARGYVPEAVARLAGTLFQGEEKRAVVELQPVRFDAARRQLVLARVVRVRLSFRGREAGEAGAGSVGRGKHRREARRELLAQLHTTARGLHAVSFEELFPSRQRGLATAQLRLQRQGEAVAFRVEPPGPEFGPGSRLYFFADAVAVSTDFTGEVAWELVRSSEGAAMSEIAGRPSGPPLESQPLRHERFEVDRFYQPGLLEARDPWLWEAMPGGATRAVSVALAGVSPAPARTAELAVLLQGGSDSGREDEHHVVLRLNGTPVAEGRFAGKKPWRLAAEVPAASLLEGPNSVEIANVGDTGVSSLVFLDKVELDYPQASALSAGRFEGGWADSGTAVVAGVASGAMVLDVTPGGAPAWLTGGDSLPGSVRFAAQAGRRYAVVSGEGVLAPRIARPALSALRDASNQADYLLIAPRAFLEAGEPLVERRRDQGLAARSVAFEEIAEAFGHGQPSAEAIREFLAYAFHSWSRPSPRYVVLLGDASYDPRRFVSTSKASPLPALWLRTSYLWTASDPALAAVNGDDLLPDMAIGRLPAATLEEAQALVAKLVAWEESGQGLGGRAVLVADDPDVAGDFEANVDDVRASFLAGREAQVLRLRVLGGDARPAIRESLDAGASLLSYVGHGGSAVWASENVWNSWDVASLRAQSQQPLLLTMNCLNGYFVAPSFDSLAEAMVKAPGRGAVAAFSPSGLSVDGPAHAYHRAIVAELAGASHERLGDAVLAAQRAYAETGLMPELLAIYHLIGDPATLIR